MNSKNKSSTISLERFLMRSHPAISYFRTLCRTNCERGEQNNGCTILVPSDGTNIGVAEHSLGEVAVREDVCETIAGMVHVAGNGEHLPVVDVVATPDSGRVLRVVAALSTHVSVVDGDVRDAEADGDRRAGHVEERASEH